MGDILKDGFYTPRSGHGSHRSFSNENNNISKTYKQNTSPTHSEDVFSNYFIQGSYKSDPNEKLLPLKKKFNKSQSSSVMRGGGLNLSLKKQNIARDSIQESHTAIVQSSSKILSEDIQQIIRKTSTKIGDIRDPKGGLFVKGDINVEDVKQLDNWKLEMKKRKLLKSDTQYANMLKQSIRTKDSHNVIFPKINTQVINRILKDSEDEEEMNNGEMSNRLKLKVLNEIETLKQTVGENDKETYKSLEVRIRESKEEIANNLVIKKVKMRLQDQNVESMSPDSLKNHIEGIAKDTLSPFKSLNGVLGRNKIEECMKIVTDKHKHEEEPIDPLDLEHYKDPLLNNHHDKEILINYRDIEITLRRDLERITESVNSLIWKRTQLHSQTKKLENEIKIYQDQISQLTERSKEKDVENSPKTPTSPSSRRLKNVNFDMQSDHITLHKLRVEARHKKAELQHKLEELRKKYFIKEGEFLNAEQELKAAKENKAKCKLKLRDLYLNLLKDETYLLKCNSPSNYAWIIQELWNMNQKIEEEDFPSFLDRDSIHYIIECAKLQDALIKYCQERNLIVVSDEFDSLNHANARDMLLLIKDIMSPNKLIYLPQNHKGKTYESILNEFKNRMKQMKGENLKTKDPHLTNYANLKGFKPITKFRYIEQGSDTILENRSSLEDMKIGHSSIFNKGGLRVEFPNDFDETGDKQVIKQVLNQLENMKNEEKDRLFKANVYKDLDLKQKENALKNYLFVFGTQDGREFYGSMCKEQKVHHQRLKYAGISPLKPAGMRVLSGAEKTSMGFRPNNVSGQTTPSTLGNLPFQKEKSNSLFQTILGTSKATGVSQSSMTMLSQLNFKPKPNQKAQSTSLSPLKTNFSSRQFIF